MKFAIEKKFQCLLKRQLSKVEQTRLTHKHPLDHTNIHTHIHTHTHTQIHTHTHNFNVCLVYCVLLVCPNIFAPNEYTCGAFR